MKFIILPYVHSKHFLEISGSTGDLAASTINQLATWMIEHPCIESDIIEVEGAVNTDHDQVS